MPYKTVRVETPNGRGGHKVTTKKVWFELPKNHSIDNMLGVDDIAQEIANEPIEFVYKGAYYKDTPANVINKLDERLWRGDIDALNYANALCLQARDVIKERREMRRQEQILNEKRGAFKAMKHLTFTDYLKDLEKTYKVAREQYDGIIDTYKEAEEAYKHTMHSTNKTALDKQEAEVMFKRATEALTIARQAIQNDYRARSQETREALKAHLDEFYDIDASKIDQDALSLIDRGIMSANELNKFAGKYKGNPTMIKLISQHAEKRAGELDRDTTEYKGFMSLYTHINKNMSNGDRELNAYDSLYALGERCLSDNESVSTGFAKKYDELATSAYESIEGMLTKPTYDSTDEA